jgi:protein O-mannosyl-transferase
MERAGFSQHRLFIMRRDWPILLLLAIVTIAVFVRVVGHEFVNYDDYAYVTLNPIVQEGLTWHGVKWAFMEPHGEVTYWHPLTWLSHMVDTQIFGLKPAGHHFGNVLFHTLNTLLLFVLLRRMTGNRAASAVVAALFALHPFQVDSVAWVAERKNLLSAAFWLLALLAYVRYAERPTAWRYGSVFLLMALGLMAKPTLVTLPCVMLLLDFWPLGRTSWMQSQGLKTTRRSAGWLLLEKVPLLALSAASSFLTIQGHREIGGLVSGEELPMPLRLANAVVSYALYLRKVIWPSDLSVFYMHPGKWPTLAVVGSGLVLLAITAIAIQQRHRRPFLIVGWLWFLGVLVPFIGLVQAHVQAMADRFAYVPIIGVFVMVVWTVASWPAAMPYRKAIQTGLAGMALAGCVIMTSLQLGHWRNSITLMERAVKVAGGNYLVHEMLGNARAERGELDAALAEYQTAIRLKPTEATPWQVAGRVLIQQGRAAEAVPYLEKAVQLAPARLEPRRRLAMALLSQGRRAEARAAYLALIPLIPPTAEGQRELADMLAEGQQFGEAIHHYREALRLKPDFVLVLNNLAWVRATAPQAEWRDGKEAVALAERVIALSGRRNPSFLGTLAAAYAEAGRFPEAVKTMQEAMTLAKAVGANQLLPIQSQMLALFQARQAFHEPMR